MHTLKIGIDYACPRIIRHRPRADNFGEIFDLTYFTNTPVEL